jgi:hypothetical protein
MNLIAPRDIATFDERAYGLPVAMWAESLRIELRAFADNLRRFASLCCPAREPLVS